MSRRFTILSVFQLLFVVSCTEKSLFALVPQKGFDLLIAAFAACVDRFPGWELVIVGEGPARAELQAQIDMLGLRERVLLAGRAGNIGDWYQRAQVYILSSRYEGMPNALLEAMCHGLPVIGVDCETGPREIIRHGADGWLVPPNDAGALAEGIATLMADEALRQRLGAGALGVRHRYSLAAVAAEWASFLADLFADLGAPRRAHRARP
jgi:glycosyltransferase involved in cell wall biosynthesis